MTLSFKTYVSSDRGVGMFTCQIFIISFIYILKISLIYRVIYIELADLEFYY